MRRRRPAKQLCIECGADVYTWSRAPLCDRCAAAIRAQPITGWTRDLRRKLREADDRG